MHHHFFVIKRAKFGQSSSGLGGRPFAGSLTPSLRRREIKRNRPAIRVRGSPRSGGCFFAHGRCQGEPGGPGRSDTASDIQSLRPAPHLGDALAGNGFFKEPARSNQDDDRAHADEVEIARPLAADLAVSKTRWRTSPPPAMSAPGRPTVPTRWSGP